MVYILVKYKDKPGKYPVSYIKFSGRYCVSENRFHLYDNPGSTMTWESAGDVVATIVGTSACLKEISIINAE